MAHKTFQLELSLQLFLHLVEVNMFEKISIQEMVWLAMTSESYPALDSQIELL